MTDISSLVWHKSSYSNGSGGNCIEIASRGSERTAVRDSKDPHGPVLGFSDGAWAEFVAAVRGERLG
jgi:hypothetical protein